MMLGKIVLLSQIDIKLVQFSATPDGNLNDISDWKNYSTKVKLQPGTGYYGPEDALFQKRVKQFKDLCNEDNVKELKTFMVEQASPISARRTKKKQNNITTHVGNNRIVCLNLFPCLHNRSTSHVLAPFFAICFSSLP